jgi:hypothetical protein
MTKNIDNMELRVPEKNSVLGNSIHRYFNWTKEDRMKAFRIGKQAVYEGSHDSH